MKEQKIKVEIWSDIACPFCYIGKTNFEKALASLSQQNNLEVIWKSFQLTPDIKTDPSISLYESLAASKGMSVEQARGMTAHVNQVAKDAGLAFHFDKVVVANTRNAHRLLHEASKHGVQNQLKHELLKAYFTEGKNIDHTETLQELAKIAGVPANRAKAVLDSDEHGYEVVQDIQESRELGVSGVPFFVFDRKYAISGAQPVAAFSEVLEKLVNELKTEKQFVDKADFNKDSCDVGGNC